MKNRKSSRVISSVHIMIDRPKILKKKIIKKRTTTKLGGATPAPKHNKMWRVTYPPFQKFKKNLQSYFHHKSTLQLEKERNKKKAN